MKKEDVIKFFGSQAEVAAALGISRAAVSQWPDEVPESSAYKIESLTAGKLRAVDEPQVRAAAA